MADSKSLKTLQKIKKPSLKVVRSSAFKVIFLHFIVFISLFTGLGFLIGSYKSQVGKMDFTIISVILFVLGVLHVWVLYSSHDWCQRTKGNGIKELFFTLVVNTLGIIGFTVALSSGSFDLSPLTAATFIFIFPFVWDKAFHYWLAIPQKKLPAFIIENPDQYKGKFNITPCKKALFFQFVDSASDLPSEELRMYMPEKGEERSLKLLLIAFLLNYKYNVTPTPIPIRHKYLNEGKKTFYEWQLFSKNRFSKQVILDADKTIKENKLKYKKWRGDDEDGREITVNYIEIVIKRF